MIKICKIVIVASMFGALIWSLVWSLQLQSEVQALDERVINLNVIYSVEGSTMEQHFLDFLRAEAEAHRSFIENQRNHLVALVGFLGAIVVAMLGFLGLKSKKEIEESVNEYYKDNIRDITVYALSKRIGDENLDNLIQSVKREKLVKKIKVLFAYTEGNYKTHDGKDLFLAFRKTAEFFQKKGYSVEEKELSLDNLKEIIEPFSIVVFCVPINQNNKRSNGNGGSSAEEAKIGLHYSDLAKKCEVDEKYGIFFVAGQINLGSVDTQWISLVNFHAKLRETLYTLLYFSPLDR